MSTSAELLEERKRTGVPTPANQSCRGLQAQGSNRGKTRLPGAADPDKSFILYHAFRNGTGICETSFYFYVTVLPFFYTQGLSPGPGFGCSRGGKEVERGA